MESFRRDAAFAYRFKKITQSSCGNYQMWLWDNLLFVGKAGHHEQARDFFWRVMHGETNDRNSNLKSFGEEYEGVFALSEIDAANEFLAFIDES